MKHKLLALGTCAALALAAGSALAQQASVERFERQLDQIQREERLAVNPDVPAGQRTYVDYGGYFTFNFFAIDDQQQSTHILRQYDLVGYGRVNVDNVHEFFLRARTSYRDFNDGDSFNGEGDETTWPTVEQAYYRFDLSRYNSAYKQKELPNNSNVVFTGGRQFVYWANGLVLAQTVDGVNLDLSYGSFTAQLLGGVTAHRTTDFDSSRPNFEDATHRGFFGGMLTAQVGKHKPFIYGLIQRDYNDEKVLTVGPVNTEFEYNSWYIGAGANGAFSDRLIYGVEFAYEGGRGLSNSFDPTTLLPVPQEKDQIQAAALDVKLDYLLSDPRRTRFTAEGIFATGDDDRLNTSNTFGGNTPGTTDHAFNAFGLINTGLAFAPSVSNLIALRAGASTFPFGDTSMLRRLQAGLDFFVFAKFNQNAPVDEPTDDSRYLGCEPDLFFNWQVTSDITWTLRYGVFFPGSAIIGPNDDNPRHFFFTGVTIAF